MVPMFLSLNKKFRINIKFCLGTTKKIKLGKVIHKNNAKYTINYYQKKYIYNT